MSYFISNKNRPSSSMVQRCDTVQREVPCDSINEYVNPNVNRRRFRPPVQTRPLNNVYGDCLPKTRVQSTMNQFYTNLPPDAVNNSPMSLNSSMPAGGHSRMNGISYEGRNSAPSTSCYNVSTPVRDTVCDNKGRTDRKNGDMPERRMQNTVASVPKLLPLLEASTTRQNTGEQGSSNENTATNNFSLRVFGSSEREKMFIFTGTVERVINWNKIFQNHFCYFEVIAAVISIQEGAIKTQRIMLLRDRKGPILQMVYYLSTHMDIEDFHVGQILRCVGKMSSTNILNAISIRSVTQEEIDTLQRLSLVCEHALTHFLNA